MSKTSKVSRNTLAVWAGEMGVDSWHRATQVPVVHSIGFGYSDLDEWQSVALQTAEGHIYSRNTNPTVRAFEEKVRQLESAEAAIGFASGMAAISDTLFALLKPGDRIVSIKDSYGGTSQIFTSVLPKFGVEVEQCDTTNHDQIETEIAQGCSLLYLETPTNPTIKITDIERLSRAAHAAGALVVVDNTFATPINQNPLALGADIVLHSASKFLGGHADALGGVICGSAELVKRVYGFREINGAVLSAGDAYRLLRGMKTLGLRIERQNSNAMQIAKHLAGHPLVEEVYYPGLPQHPNHDIAKRQMSGFGGVLSFMVKGGYDAVRTFLPHMKLAHRAANLGAVETTVGPPATTSHVECTVEERERLGIPEGLVRYSTGIEQVEDLIGDLDQALARLA
ncbi:MAG: cystathionine gamma-synthase family protein [Woeseiaceae bacterium]|jgi:cystathionine gamma-synthase|nr:cystathionine gamma-synthase family protein [Woeseiaceae bacterium]